MKSSIDKWQATVVVIVVVGCVTTLAVLNEVNADIVVTGLVGLANLVLGAGAAAHGVRQGSKASVDPPAEA